MIFLTHDEQVAYYHAPKTGSRTVLGFIAIAKHPELYKNHPGFFKTKNDNVYYNLRSRAKIYSGSRHDWAPDNNVPVIKDIPYRFCIVRDPVERFVSGYRNRVLFHNEVPGCRGIGDFIKNFNNYQNRYRTVKRHFAPQVSFYGTDSSIFTHIFRTDEMNRVREFFGDLYQIEMPELRLQQGGNDINVVLSSAERLWVEEKYQADYDAGWC